MKLVDLLPFIEKLAGVKIVEERESEFGMLFFGFDEKEVIDRKGRIAQ